MKTFEELAQDPVGTIYVDAYENGVRYLIVRAPAALAAYVGVPSDHPLANKLYENIPLDVHGGLTFGGEGDGTYRPAGWYWYGWDYAHAGDACFYSLDKRFRFPLLREETRWTVEMVQGQIWGITYDFSKIKELAESIYNAAQK